MDLLETEFDPISGIKEETWYDEMEDQLVIRREADVELDLNFNKASYNSFRHPEFKNQVFNHVASIPNIVIEQWLKEDPPLNLYNPAHKDRLLKRLNEPEWRYLRTMPGRL